MRRWFAALALVALLVLSSAAAAATLTVTWYANTEPDLVGYKIYYGTASRQYGAPVTISLGPNIPGQYQITGLAPSTTYWVALTAFNLAGAESGFSNRPTRRPFRLAV